MKYFKLFANCIPVKGAARSIICDLQRRNYEYIPNALYELLVTYSECSIEEIKNAFEGNENTIDEYFNFLTDQELGFWCEAEELKLFPEIPMEFHHPSIITNAILDFDAHTVYDLKKVSRELDLLGCKAIEFRFFDAFTIAQLDAVISHFSRSRLRHIDVLVKYAPELESRADWQQLLKKHSRVLFVIIHSAPFEQLVEFEDNFTKIEFVAEKVESEACCGTVSPAYFALNIDMFVESHHHNSCLNRKIAVDRKGQLKNCPSMAKTYGTVNDTSMLEVVNQKSFNQLWNINKNQVDICRDCEFRYICTDCRAYTQTESIYSKPSKCTYNPYTAVWE